VSALLALTDSAVEAVRHVLSSSDEVSERAGLRLVAERAGTQTNFQLSVVPLPIADDEVIEEQGARVFLEPGGGLASRRQAARRQRRARPGRVHDRRPGRGVAGEFHLARRDRPQHPVDLSAPAQEKR
jgi:hypothetical protein